MSDKIDLDVIERRLRDFDDGYHDIYVHWQNSAREREAERICTASAMLKMARVVRAALEIGKVVFSTMSKEADGFLDAIEPFRKGEK